MGEDAKPEKNVVADTTVRDFLVLCSIVAMLWLGCTAVIYFAFSDWQTRGTAGDSFGAVNALFSGLAFAGVIYALNLQRKELTYQREEMLATRRVSEAQLGEMRVARELQAQPLAIPEIAELEIERPRFFYTPPEDSHDAQSRYTLGVSLRNPTQHPALSVNVRASVQIVEPRMVLGAVDNHVPIIPAGTSITDPATRPDFLFTGDNSGKLFDSLRQRDPRKVPVVIVMVLFKNVVGAHFRLIQVFRVYARGEHLEQLRIWHTVIAGFNAKYKNELAEMRELKRRRRDDEWNDLFGRVKQEVLEGAGGADSVQLHLEPLPNSFSLSHIEKSEYEELMKSASYPQFVGALYDCPAELDGRP